MTEIIIVVSFAIIFMVLVVFSCIHDDKAFKKSKSCWKCKYLTSPAFERAGCKKNMIHHRPYGIFPADDDCDALHVKYHYCKYYKEVK